MSSLCDFQEMGNSFSVLRSIFIAAGINSNKIAQILWSFVNRQPLNLCAKPVCGNVSQPGVWVCGSSLWGAPWTGAQFPASLGSQRSRGPSHPGKKNLSPWYFCFPFLIYSPQWAQVYTHIKKPTKFPSNLLGSLPGSKNKTAKDRFIRENCTHTLSFTWQGTFVGKWSPKETDQIVLC